MRNASTRSIQRAWRTSRFRLQVAARAMERARARMEAEAEAAARRLDEQAALEEKARTRRANIKRLATEKEAAARLGAALALQGRWRRLRVRQRLAVVSARRRRVCIVLALAGFIFVMAAMLWLWLWNRPSPRTDVVYLANGSGVVLVPRQRYFCSVADEDGDKDNRRYGELPEEKEEKDCTDLCSGLLEFLCGDSNTIEVKEADFETKRPMGKWPKEWDIVELVNTHLSNVWVEFGLASLNGESMVLEAFEETIDTPTGWRMPLKIKFHRTLVRECWLKRHLSVEEGSTISTGGGYLLDQEQSYEDKRSRRLEHDVEKLVRSEEGSEGQPSSPPPHDGQQQQRRKVEMVEAAVTAVVTAATGVVKVSPTAVSSVAATPVVPTCTTPIPTATAGVTVAAPSLSETEDQVPASFKAVADKEQSPDEDTSGSTMDKTADTTVASATTGDGGTSVVAENENAPKLPNNDAVDMAVGIGKDGDCEGGGGGEEQWQKKTQLLGGAAGDVADYDGDTEHVGSSKLLPQAGRAMVQFKDTWGVAELIKEKEVVKVAEKNFGERSKSVAVTPTLALSQHPAAKGMVKSSTGNDAGGKTWGGDEAGIELEGTWQREPKADRALIAVSTSSSLSPFIATVRTRSGQGEFCGGGQPARSHTSHASSISTATTATGRSLLSGDAESAAPPNAGGASKSMLAWPWPQSPAGVQVRENSEASWTAWDPMAPADTSLSARIGSLETEAGAVESSTSLAAPPDMGSSSTRETRAGAETAAPAGSSVSARIGILETEAGSVEPPTSLSAPPARGSSTRNETRAGAEAAAPADSSLSARIGSLETAAGSVESSTSLAALLDKGSLTTTMMTALSDSATRLIAHIRSLEAASASKQEGREL